MEPINLDDVIIRKPPQKSTPERVDEFVKENPQACRLLKESGMERDTVFEYLQVHVAYLDNNRPRKLANNLKEVYAGMKIAKQLDESDIHILTGREYFFQGSWEKMFECFEKNKDRQLYKIIKKPQKEIEDAKIQRLIKLEQENNINLADYVLAI